MNYHGIPTKVIHEQWLGLVQPAVRTNVTGGRRIDTCSATLIKRKCNPFAKTVWLLFFCHSLLLCGMFCVISLNLMVFGRI